MVFFMRLKGIVEIKITDIDGNIKDSRLQENMIFDASWLGVLGNDAVRGYFNRSISIATDNTNPVATNNTVTGVIGTCSVPAGVTSPVFIENVDPPFGTLTGQISPTGVQRTFTSVALTALGGANTQNIASTTAFARLKLDIPCTQGVNDFVNITYSIQFLDNVGDTLPNATINRYDFGRAMFGLGDYRMGNIYYNFAKPNLAMIAIPPAGIFDATTGAINTPNYKWNYTKSINKNTQLGAIINAIPQGLTNNNLQAYAMGFYEYDKAPIQTGFKHGANSLIPFFDSINIASSQGSVHLAGTWTGGFPEFYKITFTDAGATGTATYKFSVFKHIGFNDNAYTFRDVDSLYLRPNIQWHAKLHGWKEEDFDKHRLSNTEIVQYDINGISIVDVIHGTCVNYDATTAPALLCTNIRQIAVDTANRLIYVACRNTGLWIVNITANTISNPLTSPCYGCDVGRNNIAVAIVQGGLYRSTDWVNPQTFTYTDITNNWACVHFLKADPEHANDRIAIVAQNPTNTANRIVWHQFSDNSTTTGFESVDLQIYPSSLDVSDVGSKWVYFIPQTFFKINFNAPTSVSSFSSFSKPLNHSIYGNRRFSKVSFLGDSIFVRGGNFLFEGFLVDGTITQSIGWLPNIQSGFNDAVSFCLSVLHLDSGIVLINGAPEPLANVSFRQIFPNGNANLTTNYGWDGANWIKDNPNSKPTHSDAQLLINGLTIRFQDGANPPHFVLNEFQTQGVNWGLLKDNATDLVWKSAWYSRATNKATITPVVLASTTVVLAAASDPYFSRIDDDSTAIPHRFFLDGVLVSKVWTNGTAPAPTEVSLNANGTLTFNAADVGKTLSGTYIWIEV